MMAHFFLWHIKIHLGEKAPSITLSQLRIVLGLVLPLRRYEVTDAIELVIWIQKKNHVAYLSHQRKNIAKREKVLQVSL